MKKTKNTKGLILAEALLAITLLSISVVVTASIIQGAMKTTHLSRNYLVAQNLVTEGIEAVNSIRDTNWLQKPSDSSCWLRVNTSSLCGDEFEADDGSNISYLAKNESGVWMLEELTKNLDLENQTELYAADFRLNYFDVSGIQTFSHSAGEASPYYRSVKFFHVSDVYATFDVRVEWKEGQKVRSIIKSVTILNYF